MTSWSSVEVRKSMMTTCTNACSGFAIKNLTLNRAKCQFNKNKIEFFGHVFSSDGVSPDPKKVESLHEASAPSSKEEVRSLLGMATYCSRFIPSLATITQPIRELTKDKTPFTWNERHHRALESIKSNISTNCSTAYFDPKKKTEVIVDASPVGIAAILAQVDDNGATSIVALASRSLTDVEQRYSQTEREALAVTWSILHYHLYIYGSSVTVVTDHKPLLPLFNNSTSKPTMRIERWVMRLQEYDYNLIYRPGKLNPADYMSRHPSPTTKPSSREEKLAEEYINLIMYHAVPRTMTLEIIETETANDTVLQQCMSALKNNNWHEIRNKGDNKSDIESLYKVRDELSVTNNNILLRDHRIVIPRSLQQQAVDIAHEGHQGMVKTKQLLRLKIWFPHIDKIVDQTVASCLACQVSTIEKNATAPIVMTNLPNSPWEAVSVDFKELPTGEYLLVVVDDYSRFPIVELVSSTSARCVVPKLDSIFAVHGTPRVMRTDNGPPFNGAEFASFAEYLDFKHRKVTPLWPQANGEVERMMRNLKKLYRTAKTEQQNWKQALNKYLRNYRATPHSSTGVAPATMLLGRDVRTRLPELPPKRKNDKDIRDRDQKAKDKMKSNAEKNKTLTKKSIEVGDYVLLKRDGTLKTHLNPYHSVPYKVTKVKGSMITATNEDRCVTRNISFFKPVVHQPDPDITAPVAPPATNQEPPRQRPQRAQRLPAHLQDYVLEDRDEDTP